MQVWRYVAMVWSTIIRVVYGHKLCSGPHLYDPSSPNQPLECWNAEILGPVALQVYADTIHQKGAPLQNCFGFIDGTVRPIARLGTNQRVMYNGHKHVHSLKFQAIATPNVLIAHLYGPVGM